MNHRITALVVVLVLAAGMVMAQEVVVSKKQDVAVFALGYYGYDLPIETLANVDAEIQGVFINLGRFNVLGQTERFSSQDIQAFIDLLKKSKETNTPLPDEVKFGEVQITEALLNKLYGAFVVVIPTIVSYDSGYNSKTKTYETTIKSSFAFLDVANGTTIGFATVETSGSSKETQFKSIKGAIDGIASRLDHEVRSIPAFTISTRILQVSGGEVKMQLGADMGIKVGDEYAVIEKSTVAGFADEREDGLLLVKNVGPQISTATVLISGATVTEGAQLKEIPRQGGEVSPYLRVHSMLDGGLAIGIGAKALVTRGFYSFRPLVGVEALLDFDRMVPLQVYAGGEYDIFMGQLAVNVSAGVGAASNMLIRFLDENFNEEDEEWVSHYGFTVSGGASFLINRDMKVFADVGFDYWIGLFNGLGKAWDNYGSLFGNVGIALKL